MATSLWPRFWPTLYILDGLQLGCVCSSSAGDGRATGGGGVFRPDDTVPVSSGGSGSVARSQRCDTLSARTYSAAAHDASRCHGDERQQQQQPRSACTGVHGRCCSGIGLGVVSATCRFELGHHLAFSLTLTITFS